MIIFYVPWNPALKDSYNSDHLTNYSKVSMKKTFNQARS